jgi:microcystin-dependent protein
MAYQIRFTDQDKEPIVVEDNTIDQSTSVSFPGRNTTGYGQLTAENFLHLLENFVNTTAPTNPVEGQLWYDNTDGINQLKIYTGTTWTSAGGVKKGPSEPDLANSYPGDLWSNTDTQQLFLFTGSGWILVGPRFSAGARTGVEPEVISDIFGVNHSVASMYVDGVRIAIINHDASSTGFTPRQTIPGFGPGNPIKPGITLNDELNEANAAYIYWGIAEKAQNLLIDGEVVSGDKFLRSDIAGQIVEEDLTINGPLKLGSGAIEITVNDIDAVFTNKLNSGSIDLKVTDTTGISKSAIHINNGNNVLQIGLGTSDPTATLHVIGNILSTGPVNILSTTQSTNKDTGALVIEGGLGVEKNLNIGGELKVIGQTTVGNILPQTNLNEIGSSVNRFSRIFARRVDVGVPDDGGGLYGTVVGTLQGNATGSAARLASPTFFSFNGDVTLDLTVHPDNYLQFNGQIGGTNKTFATKLSDSFISSKDAITVLDNNDEFIISRGIIGPKKIKKSDVWSQISRTPVATVVAFAGPVAPKGWLLCDGAEVLISQYSELFGIIGGIYHNINPYNAVTNPKGLRGIPGQTFRIPDLRGRVTLGLDNMDNSNVDTPNITTTLGNQVSAGGGNANIVSSLAADTLGAVAGSEVNQLTLNNVPNHVHDLQSDQDIQYYALRNDPVDPADASVPGPAASITGQGWYLDNTGGVQSIPPTPSPFGIMNPYMAINYIIFTGKDVT